jgi:acetyltransferase-like isoleucine patch superfamily enzyme
VTSRRSRDAATSRLSVATEFGTILWARGYIRRRAGLILTRLFHPRVEFGHLCDVRRNARFRVAKGANTRFGAGCILDGGFTLENRGRIDVGDRTVFGHHCTVAADMSIVIGENCLIGEMVSIRDHDHSFSSSDVLIIDQGRKASPIRIGDNVWIGAKATITSGVCIGSNVIIGAHAVVTRDIPPNCVAMGIPARVIRHREVTS